MRKATTLLLILTLFAGPFGCSGRAPNPPLVGEKLDGDPVQTEQMAQQGASDRNNFRLTEELLAEAEHQYGFPARQRLNEWEELIRADFCSTDMEKLRKINSYVNKVAFVDDETQWGLDDYWATPVEFLASGGGDCEDFALAKYFSLIAMGVNKRRLYLTYMRDINTDEYHMVMTYAEVPGETPLVLDNLTDEITPATQRTDLLPVYSVNDSGLWMAQTRSKGQLVGMSSELHRWQELLSRITEGCY